MLVCIFHYNFNKYSDIMETIQILIPPHDVNLIDTFNSHEFIFVVDNLVADVTRWNHSELPEEMAQQHFGLHLHKVTPKAIPGSVPEWLEGSSLEAALVLWTESVRIECLRIGPILRVVV